MKISNIFQLILVSLTATSSLGRFSIHEEGFVQKCKDFKSQSPDKKEVTIPRSLSFTGKELKFRLQNMDKSCKSSAISLDISPEIIQADQLNPTTNPTNDLITPPLIQDLQDNNVTNATFYDPENNSFNASNSSLPSTPKPILITAVSSDDDDANHYAIFNQSLSFEKQKKFWASFRKAWMSQNETKLYPNGYMRYQNEYFRPEDYCISKVSDTQMDIQVCTIDCSDKDTVCIPKCCGVGESLVYWSFTCKPVKEDLNEAHWSPTIYNYAKTKPLSLKEKENLNIHYTKPFQNCLNVTQKSIQRQPFINPVVRPSNKRKDHDPGSSWYIMKSGEIHIRSYTRNWVPIGLKEGTYCVDGFANWGETGGKGIHEGTEEEQVILYCPNPDDSNAPPQSFTLYYTYAGVLLASSTFLLLTAVVHIVLYERQNIHGLTILSQAVSLFFMYVLQGLAYVLTPFLANGRSNICWTVGMLAHFFFLSTFSWLTVVNYDLWLTFRSMRPVSKMSKKMRRFRLYSVIGWGVPVVLMIIFLSLEFCYPDPMSDVKIPDYGKRSCYVASHVRNEYLCSILAVVIPINLIMIISTFKIFYDFRNGKGAWTSKAAKSDRYSFKLFMKLFFVMGAVWITELIVCWFYQGQEPPWFIIILNCAMPLQAIAFFGIFCCNRRTMTQLEEKHNCFRTIFGPLRRIFGVSKSLDDCQTNDTTPNTPGGLRKGSVVSLSLSGTMDRKFSAESVVRKFENVELESMHSTS